MRMPHVIVEKSQFSHFKYFYILLISIFYTRNFWYLAFVKDGISLRLPFAFASK